jgi:hypothetical protein
MADAGLRRGSILVIAEGDAERFCPIWKDLYASGRVEAVVDLEALALSAARIPSAHSANMVEAFPRPRDLDRYLAIAAVTGFSAAAAIGAATFQLCKQLRTEDGADSAHSASLQARLGRLGANKKEMAQLRNEAPDGSRPFASSRHDALVGLAAAIPDALTLTSLAIGGDGGFEIEAMVVGDIDQEKTRQSFERFGFVPGKDKGWDYNVGTGRLSIQGNYHEVRP